MFFRSCVVFCGVIVLANTLDGAASDLRAQQVRRAGANAGTACPEPERRVFDFWIGEWDVQNRTRPATDTAWTESGRATDRVYPVVGGCAIVEDWEGVSFFAWILGFSIRVWEPDTGKWRIVLLWPNRGEPRFGELTGGFRHGRGEFFSEIQGPQGPLQNRFTFTDIAADRLRWESATSPDRGRSWSSGWIMEFSRRGPDRTALLHGASMTTQRCAGSEHRLFDDLLGEWRGLRHAASGDSVPVRVELLRTLEGCAILERAWSPDESWEFFAILAFEPGTGEWVEYSLESEATHLVRRAGRPDTGRLRLTPATGAAGAPRTWRFTGGRPGWSAEPGTPAATAGIDLLVRLGRPIPGG
jgi:hypothetical protein